MFNCPKRNWIQRLHNLKTLANQWQVWKFLSWKLAVSEPDLVGDAARWGKTTKTFILIAGDRKSPLLLYFFKRMLKDTLVWDLQTIFLTEQRNISQNSFNNDGNKKIKKCQEMCKVTITRALSFTIEIFLILSLF